MWRTVTGERPGGNGVGRTTPTREKELPTVGLFSQDSPLLGLLSAVSRPAVSFLQRWSPYLAGRTLKRDFVEQESDLLPPHQLRSLPWFNLSELGVQTPEGPGASEGLQAQSLVLIHPARGASKTWLSALWGGVEDEPLKSAPSVFTTAFIHERTRRTGVTTDKTRNFTPELHGLTPGLHGLTPELPVLAPELPLFAPELPLFTPELPLLLTPELPPPEHPLFAPELPVLTPELPLIASGLPPLAPDLVYNKTSAIVPDLDNGYSSLEEELLAAKAQLRGSILGAELPALKCDNKSIAFIMGCPCSGSDSSDSEDNSDGDDGGDDDGGEDDGVDDDGFGSVCSSDFSDSDDVEDEFDSEAERLWNALCQNDDPYNPRNFSAKLGTAPRPIPRAGPGPELGSSSSSSVSSSSWDEASDAEGERETLKLLESFCSLDPYSPLNFKAAIRTKPGPASGPSLSPRLEENRVRKISESSASSRATSKKVRFCVEVQVFAVGCEERRGQWEEFARDRARFAKRCDEMAQVLSPCLHHEHRRRVYLQLSQSQPEESRGAGQSQSEESGGAGQSQRMYK